MRSIVHLSDIHFGAVDNDIATMVIAKVNDIDPHLIVVSGDLTQRARSSQFIAAREFLDSMKFPQIVVPGNHDVPLYNVVDRFVNPLEKYRRYITDDLTPEFVDDEIAVVGVSTVRSFVIKGGRINNEQVADVRRMMGELPDDMLKVLVTHHPFDLPEGHDEDDMIGRAGKAFPRLAECGVNLFLAGHLHVANIETTAKRYELENGHTALIVQAGTATSSRVRGEPHSFNHLEWDRPKLTVKRFECLQKEDGFFTAEIKEYSRVENGWVHLHQNKL